MGHRYAEEKDFPVDNGANGARVRVLRRVSSSDSFHPTSICAAYDTVRIASTAHDEMESGAFGLPSTMVRRVSSASFLCHHSTSLLPVCMPDMHRPCWWPTALHTCYSHKRIVPW